MGIRMVLKPHTKVDGTISTHQVTQFVKDEKPKLATHCANCSFCFEGCLSTDHCQECLADKRAGKGKTGFDKRDGITGAMAGCSHIKTIN